MKDLEKIVIDMSLIERNKSVYKQRLNNPRLSFESKIKTGARQRIDAREGEITIDAIETFWASYGSIKGTVAAKASKDISDMRFVELYSLFVASSYAFDTFSSQIESPVRYMGLSKLELSSDESLLINSLMTNFLNTTGSCNTGKTLARAALGFFQQIKNLSGEQLNTRYHDHLETFEKKYHITLGEKFTAQGTGLEAIDPNEGKPTEKVTFDDIGGYENIVEYMKFFVSVLKDPKYSEVNYKKPKGICFYGLPGTGKTLMAKAVACESEYPFYYLNLGQILSKWVGESEKNLFTKLTRKGIHFLDEADSLLGLQKDGDSNHHQTLINVYSEAVSGFRSNPDAMYIIATNNIKLDPKIKRAGRTDHWFYFGMPEPNAIHQILQIHAKKLQDGASRQVIIGLDYSAITNAIYAKSVNVNKKYPNLAMVGADCAEVLRTTHEKACMKYWKTNEFRPMTTADVLETVREYNLEVRA